MTPCQVEEEPAQLYSLQSLTTLMSFFLGFEIYFCTKHELKLLVFLFYCASVRILCLLLSILLDNFVTSYTPDLL